MENDFRIALEDNNSILNTALNIVPGVESGMFPLVSNFMENLLKNLTLLSLYFSRYPYILNLLSFQEVKDLFKDKFDIFTMMNEQMSQA